MGRVKEVLDSVDDTRLSQDTSSITGGRKTVLEYMFLEGLVQSFACAKGAIDKLDVAVSAMEKANMVQSDIHGAIWSFTSQVMKGGKLA